MSIRAGGRVEYGMGSSQGRDRLGQVVALERRRGQDCALIRPLSVTAGDGTLPNWYPLRMVQPTDPARWQYNPQRNTYQRLYPRGRGTR